MVIYINTATKADTTMDDGSITGQCIMLFNMLHLLNVSI
jgi:hypothetical protein